MALKLSDFFKIERDPCYRIGERKGELKGKKKTTLTIARKMKSEGLSILLISKATKLSIDQIKKL
jgi:predicted transposase/invertase (TIGR01784 family)